MDAQRRVRRRHSNPIPRQQEGAARPGKDRDDGPTPRSADPVPNLINIRYRQIPNQRMIMACAKSGLLNEPCDDKSKDHVHIERSFQARAERHLQSKSGCPTCTMFVAAPYFSGGAKIGRPIHSCFAMQIMHGSIAHLTWIAQSNFGRFLKILLAAGDSDRISRLRKLHPSALRMPIAICFHSVSGLLALTR